MDNPHQIGAVCTLEGDKRYPEPRRVRVLDNRDFPIYHVAVGAPDGPAPGEYDAKAERAAVTHSKLKAV